jgi:hypothetical protein
MKNSKPCLEPGCPEDEWDPVHRLCQKHYNDWWNRTYGSRSDRPPGLVECRCGAAWTGAKVEHCTACHATFSSTIAGDWHRVGKHAVTTGFDRRRCLTEAELVEHPKLTPRTNGFGTTVWGQPGERPIPEAAE